VQLLAQLLLLLVYKGLKVGPNKRLKELSSPGCLPVVNTIEVLTQDIPETVDISHFGIGYRKGDD
jgi:hypothetical protein